MTTPAKTPDSETEKAQLDEFLAFVNDVKKHAKQTKATIQSTARIVKNL